MSDKLIEDCSESGRMAVVMTRGAPILCYDDVPADSLTRVVTGDRPSDGPELVAFLAEDGAGHVEFQWRYFPRGCWLDKSTVHPEGGGYFHELRFWSKGAQVPLFLRIDGCRGWKLEVDIDGWLCDKERHGFKVSLDGQPVCVCHTPTRGRMGQIEADAHAGRERVRFR